MGLKNYPSRPSFGLLPEPEGRTGSFVTSMVVNGIIMAIALVVSLLAKPAIQEHNFEQTELIFPTSPPPPTPVKIKIPPPPPVKDMQKPPVLKFEEPKIQMPKPEPEPKPVVLETKIDLPTIKAGKPQIMLAPQPKAALATVATPAQNNLAKRPTEPVHLGEMFGVTPNPNATLRVAVAAIGDPYGGMNVPAVAPHGVVGSTGIGNGLKSGSNAGTVGMVTSAGIPSGTGTTTGDYYSNARVASAGIPAAAAFIVPQMAVPASPNRTQAEVSVPKPAYTDEAKQMKIQGAVVLRVTFRANGQILVLGVLRGLGHGLDEEAIGSVQQGHVIRPAMVNGKPMDSTTNITITFELA